MKNRILLLLGSLVGFVALAVLPVAAADQKLAGKDKEFVEKAAIGGLAEVQLGQLAQEKAESPDVKAFGQRMVADHAKANEDLKLLAQKKNWKLPTELDRKHRKLVDDLKKLSGAEFDRRYMKEMVKDHTKDVAQFRMAAKTAKDADLSGWAGTTLPVLEEHLQRARQIAQTLGVDVAKAEEEGRKEAGEKARKK